MSATSDPIILAVDTTHEIGSLALLRGEDLLEEVTMHSPEGFGHVLFDHLGQLLQRHGITVTDPVCFATASGPGSFTGVRVGLACIKGLAEACGSPAVGVSNLEALASFGTHALRAALLDARRGEIYGAVYNAAGQVAAPEVVMKFPAWIATLPEGDLEFVSQDFTPFQAALQGTRFAQVPVFVAPGALAAAVGRIGFERWRLGMAQDPAGIDANYVRRSDAELFWKDR